MWKQDELGTSVAHSRGGVSGRLTFSSSHRFGGPENQLPDSCPSSPLLLFVVSADVSKFSWSSFFFDFL